MMHLLAQQVQAAPLVLHWRELLTIGVASFIVWLSYALKESLQTRAHVHITRQGSDADATSRPDAGGGGG